MSANVHPNVRSGVRQRLGTLAGLPAQRHWEGLAFDPERGVPFMAEVLRPIGSAVRGMGSSAAIAHTIVASFTLNYPAGQGTTAIEQAASALMDGFRPGASVVYGGQSALITQVERSPLRQEPDWLQTTVSATLIAYTFT